MRTHAPQRSPEQRATDYTARMEPHCRCSHFNWVTCLAKQEGMSRFNAMIVFGHGDIDKQQYGKCTCPCHRDANDQQVSETVWNRRCGGRASA